MAWTSVSAANSNWATQTATATGAAGNNTAAGTFGWIDVAGGIWNVVNPSGTAGLLEGNPTTANSASANLTRPSGEAVAPTTGSRLLISFTALTGTTVTARLGAILRFFGTNAYLFQATSGGGTGITVVSVTDMTTVPPTHTAAPTGGGGTASNTITINHTYTFDCYVFGNSPTFLGGTLTDTTTTPTVLGTFFTWDNLAALQSVTGIPALATWRQTTGTPGTVAVSAIQTFTGSPPAATAINVTCATTGSTGTPQTLTFQPSGDVVSSLTITPSDGGGGGTFSPTTVSLTAGSAASGSCTYTPATTGTKTITFTDTSSLTHIYNGAVVATTSIALVVSSTPTQTITLSVSTLAANPGAATAAIAPYSVGVVGVGTSWTPGTINPGSGTQLFRVSGGFAPFISQMVITSATAATIMLDPGWYGAATTPAQSTTLTITDTSTTATATIAVTPAVLGTINFAMFGDSIFASDVNNTFGALCGDIQAALTAIGWSVPKAICVGVDGTDTTQWLPNSTTGQNSLPNGSQFHPWVQVITNGSSVQQTVFFGGNTTPYFQRAINALSTFGLPTGSFVLVNLQTNDMRPQTNSYTRAAPTTPATHHANMAAIVAAIVAAGYKVMLTKALWLWPYANGITGGAATNGEMWPGNVNEYYSDQYWLLDSQLADGVNVFIADGGAGFQYSMDNFTFLQTTGSSPGIHPAGSASDLIYAQILASGMSHAFGGGAGGTVIPPTQVFIAGAGSTPVSTAQTLSFFLDHPATASTQVTVAVSGVGTVTQPSPIGIGSIGPVTCTYSAGVTAGSATVSFTNNAGLANTGSPKSITVTSSGGGISNPWTHG